MTPLGLACSAVGLAAVIYCYVYIMGGEPEPDQHTYDHGKGCPCPSCHNAWCDSLRDGIERSDAEHADMMRGLRQ